MKRMRTTHFTLIFTALWLFTGCALRPRIPEPRYKPLQKLEVAITQINFLDRRSKVKKGKIKLPFFAGPNKVFKHSPVLDEHYKNIMQSEIQSRSRKKGPEMVANIEVTSGLQKVTTGWMTVTFETDVKLNIIISDEGGQNSFYCDSYGSNYIKHSGAVADDHIDTMLEKAYKSATIICLEKVKEEMDKVKSQDPMDDI